MWQNFQKLIQVSAVHRYTVLQPGLHTQALVQPSYRMTDRFKPRVIYETWKRCRVLGSSRLCRSRSVVASTSTYGWGSSSQWNWQRGFHQRSNAFHILNSPQIHRSRGVTVDLLQKNQQPGLYHSTRGFHILNSQQTRRYQYGMAEISSKGHKRLYRQATSGSRLYRAWWSPRTLAFRIVWDNPSQAKLLQTYRHSTSPFRISSSQRIHHYLQYLCGMVGITFLSPHRLSDAVNTGGVSMDSGQEALRLQWHLVKRLLSTSSRTRMVFLSYKRMGLSSLLRKYQVGLYLVLSQLSHFGWVNRFWKIHKLGLYHNTSTFRTGLRQHRPGQLFSIEWANGLVRTCCHWSASTAIRRFRTSMQMQHQLQIKILTFQPSVQEEVASGY